MKKKKKALKTILSSVLSLALIVPMAYVGGKAGLSSVPASAIEQVSGVTISEQDELGGGATYTLWSNGVLEVFGDEAEIPAGIFPRKDVREIYFHSSTTRVHPQAFKNNPSLSKIYFDGPTEDYSDPVEVEGFFENLPAGVEVTIPMYSQKVIPATVKFDYVTYSSEAYAKAQDLQTRFNNAMTYWNDTADILAEAEADENITVTPVASKTEELTENNWSTVFPSATVSFYGTCEGTGTREDPLIIANMDNWRYISYLTTKGKLVSPYYSEDDATYMKLTTDLTLSDSDGTLVLLGGRETKSNGGYTDHHFMGIFDGDGHTITIYANNTGVSGGLDGIPERFGLFPSVDCAWIKNLHISGSVTSDEMYTGLFVGHGSHVKLINCSSDADLTLTINGEARSGSFMGYAYNTVLYNCDFTGTITGQYATRLGGFVGYAYGGDGIISGSYFRPSMIDTTDVNNKILYNPAYSSSYMDIEEDVFYNQEATYLQNDTNYQGTSDKYGVSALTDGDYWQSADGKVSLTLPQASATANSGTHTFAYTGDEHVLIVPIQSTKEYYTYGGVVQKNDNYEYMEGQVYSGSIAYKLNDGEWTTTVPKATEIGDYTIYYMARGDLYHRDSEVYSMNVSIVEAPDLQGSGTPADPYLINDALDWSTFCGTRDTKDKYYKLTDDIIVSETRSGLKNGSYPAFSGAFDGDGHTIWLYSVNTRGYYGASLFGDTSGFATEYSDGSWHYWSPVIKNLTLEGTVYIMGVHGGFVGEAESGITIANCINNQTIVQMSSGGVATGGIIEIASLREDVHILNCMFTGIFVGNNNCWYGIGEMSTYAAHEDSLFEVSNCFVNPLRIEVTANTKNAVFVHNTAGYRQLNNCFFNEEALKLVPKDDQGNTTNTDGQNANIGLETLDMTGYWEEAKPKMPVATISDEPYSLVVNYTGQSEWLCDEGYAEGGTMYYKIDDCKWSTEIPTAVQAGVYTISYKVVGDSQHRDSEEYSFTSRIFDPAVIDWAVPANLTVTVNSLPYADDGETLTSGEADVTVSWDENEDVFSCKLMAKVTVASGEEYWLNDSINVLSPLMEAIQVELRSVRGAPGDSTWSTVDGRNNYTLLLPVLGPDDTQEIYANTYVNGIKQGDTVTICATASAPYDDDLFETNKSNTASFVAAKTLQNRTTVTATETVAGDTLTLNGDAFGGTGAREYAAYYKTTSAQYYKTLQDYSSESSIDFIPAAAGTYNLRSRVRDSRGKVSTKNFVITVNSKLANTSTVNTESLELGGTANIALSCTGGLGEKTYAVYYKLSTAKYYTTLQNFDENAAVGFTPSKSGTYNIRTKVKDARGIIAVKDFNLTVFDPLENTSSLSAGTIQEGDSVTLTLASTGGLGDVQYAAYYKASTAKYYSTLQGFGDASQITITPAAYGTYNVRTKVKDSRGKTIVKDMDITVNPLPLENTTAISSTTVDFGSSTTLNLESGGGVAPVEYAVYYKLSTAKYYTTLQNFSSNKIVEFKPAAVALYNVRTKAKDVQGTIAVRDFEVTVNPAPLTNDTTVSATAVETGGSINVALKSSGGTGTHKYAVYMKTAAAKYFTTVQAFDTNNSVDIQFTKAGAYIVRTKVQDENNKTTVKDFDITVTDPLENISSISDDEIFIGDSITVNCASKGGAAPVQYAVYTKLSTATYYSTLQAFGDSTSAVFTPQAIGTYNVLVKAKDSRNKTVSKLMTLDVNARPLSLTAKIISDGEPTTNDPITIVAMADGGEGDIQYAFFVKEQGSTYFSTISSYSSTDSVTYTPKKEGTLTIRARAKDSKTTVTKEMQTTVAKVQLENTSKIDKETITEGESVTVKCSARGGEGEREYAVYVKKQGATYYSTFQSWSTNAKVVVSNLLKGKNLIQVKVRDSSQSNSVSSKVFTVTVNEKPTDPLAPQNFKVKVKSLPVSSGNVAEGTMLLDCFFDDQSQINDIEAYAWVELEDGSQAILYKGNTYSRAGENVPSSYAFHIYSGDDVTGNPNVFELPVPVLGPNTTQVVKDGFIQNGVKQGQIVNVAVTGLVNQDGNWSETSLSNPAAFSLLPGVVGHIYSGEFIP